MKTAESRVERSAEIAGLERPTLGETRAARARRDWSDWKAWSHGPGG
jgi:hypothetical protein